MKKEGRRDTPPFHLSRMDLTFVFPCLNESRTIALCIDAVRKSLEVDPALNYEIVVADNGSTDDSRQIATAHGARVVPVPQRGYGAALRGGIEAAEGKYVMFADADGTYFYENSLELYKTTAKADADMGIASRMKGVIEPGAMPTLHRVLGTPVLTGLINLLFKGKLSDCNSGFRCLKKTAYKTWDIRASGMEFASELLIKALKKKASTVEIVSGLRPAPVDRTPHLRTWRDGMRHLLFILSERPRMFELGGLVLIIVASLLQAISAVTGLVNVAGLTFLGVHSQVLLLLAALVGTQIYMLSAAMFLQQSEKPRAITRKLIEMDEGSLFFLLVTLLGSISLVIGWLVIQWARSSFAGLDYASTLIVWLHFLAVPSMITFGMLGVHILRKGKL
ncbi:glycosyl transferase [Brevifollis gellanilyticus]|uniref:Glycosyl transferase n=2 Tax=Brevifollis gellanilyticus TaxID=748831 RepID=A0A512M612_9BACT|nr:glycosyl transferase [Brevifollis gellanilyticus]